MTCKGICLRHRAPKPIHSGRYASGQKRCQVCDVFLKWVCLWCPCCGSRLRTKSRNSTFKETFAMQNKTANNKRRIKDSTHSS